MTRPLTGRMVLAIALTAFGVIVAVNLTLTWFAVRTFSGLVVPNSYVASQGFDERRTAQEALGWQLDLDHAGGTLQIALTDRMGQTVRPELLEVTVGRPSTVRDDRMLAMEPMPGGYGAEVALAPGSWRVEIVALAADGTGFHQSRSLVVTP